jgi:geranylgeranyl pyrophosphate synthase
MSTKKKQALKVKALLWEKGQRALELAKQTVKQEKIPSEPIQQALEYFIDSWKDVVHPASLALSCEAVGGKAEETTQIGVAFVLLAGGADIHDDIIDESTFKYSKKTVLGKFGKDIAILAGDALLFKGLYVLHEACEALPMNQKRLVLESTMQAFFGISSAEAMESNLKASGSIVAEEYLSMIKTKAAVAEATMRIGAIIGGGSLEEIEALASFGKTFGTLLTIRDEFIDVFELNEIKNRAKREWLPLPILYTFKDTAKKEEILSLLKGDPITKKAVERTLEIVIASKETQELKCEMYSMIEEENQRLSLIKKNQDKFKLMLKAIVEDF